MADYVRTTLMFEASENADYSDPIIKDTTTYAITADEVHTRLISVPIGGATLETGLFEDIDLIVVYNKDDTNYVTARYDPGGGLGLQTTTIQPGHFHVSPVADHTDDLLLTANTAAVECEVVIAGKLA